MGHCNRTLPDILFKISTTYTDHVMIESKESNNTITQNYIGVSSNGRTSGFGPEYRGSNPCTPAREKAPARALFHLRFGVQGFEERSDVRDYP